MNDARIGGTTDGRDPCAIVEIRQYTLLPGKRDVLIDLFERYFLDGLTECGMTVIGLFRTLDDPNRLFWMRGFASMEARREALEAFYGGPLWAAHRNVANATMVDSDNVLLVRPAAKGSGLRMAGDAGPQARREHGAVLVATIYHPEIPVTNEFVALFQDFIEPAATRAGAHIAATYVTENSPNDFPALPVRPVHSFAWFAWYVDEIAYARYRNDIERDPAWAAVRQRFAELKNYAAPEVWRLTPTSRTPLQALSLR